MNREPVNAFVVGKYSGVIAEKYRDPQLLSQLENIAELVGAPDSETISSGRNRNTKLTLARRDGPLIIAAKCFGAQSHLKDLADHMRGSKARRTWLAASVLHEKGVGTPAPVGFLERWNGSRLAESYYLAEFQAGITSFMDELVRLLLNSPATRKFMSLMQCVADAVRAMHETGFQHNDLGNQNILLRRKGDGEWGDVKFIDLNRARFRGMLSLHQRARDISRLYLPSDLLRIFKDMYYGNTQPPEKFQQWERFHRKLYALHSGTRKIRHPLRSLRSGQQERNKASYPSEKDMWIWDQRSAQAISALRPRDRLRFRPMSGSLRIAGTTLAGLPSIWREYRSLLETCYKTSVSLKDRIGVAVDPKPETIGREIELLEKLGKIPAFLRFYCHESEEQWNFSAKVVRELHANGHCVSTALVQDRRAVTEPGRWTSFVSHVLDQVAAHVELVEVGHAINRVKWGVWDLNEHRRLLNDVADLADKFPDVKFMGPAVMDFEYPFLMAALKNLPEPLHFNALSHHLYVDRRGAPENRQGFFSALEKFALARAVARSSHRCEDRFIVSEVNWPIKGTGVYSPVSSPYESPGVRHGDPSVSEDEYADYMIRYLLIALCSGMVDRVYWWRLTARGFGLVDDTDPETWRERPAYLMLKHFLSLLGKGSFIKRVALPHPSGRPGPASGAQDGIHVFEFDIAEDKKVCLGYSSIGDVDVEFPFECSRITDSFGEELEPTGKRVRLSGRPVYVFA